LGVPVRPDEVSTSAPAAAELLAGRLAAGVTVLVVGADSLADDPIRDRHYTAAPTTQLADPRNRSIPRPLHPAAAPPRSLTSRQPAHFPSHSTLAAA